MVQEESFEKKITILRNKGRLTQAQLADHLGINIRTLARWESGKGRPKDGIFDEIVRICQESYPKAFTSSHDNDNIDNDNRFHSKNTNRENHVQQLLQAKNEVIQLQKEIIENLKSEIDLKAGDSKSLKKIKDRSK